MKKQKKLNNKGFSMVELVIVIAIMAVLIAVLAPQYIKYVESSRVSTDDTNAAEILKTVQLLVADTTIKADCTVAWSNGAIAAANGNVDNTDVKTAVETALGGTNEVPAIKSNLYDGKTYTVTVTFNNGSASVTGAWSDAAPTTTLAPAVE